MSGRGLAFLGSLSLLCLAWTGDAADELPEIRLEPGELYFRLDGTPSFLLGRNPTGRNIEEFAPLLEWAGDSGERIARFHLLTGLRPKAPPGEVDEEWAQRWEEVFDMAARRGIHVLPVFSAWAKWNDGSGKTRLHFWDRNPFNAELGGPAAKPIDLFRDTPSRALWLKWVEALVRRWRDRPNILGWEIFSELDLVTGATEAEGLVFVRRAAEVIRAADPRSRPVTASLAGVRQWPTLFESDAVDFIQVHPYAGGRRQGNLDKLILTSVRERLERYGKPIFIGECGLDAGGPRNELVNLPRAPAGIRHAIWAAAVSGAMNGRMLWYEDGYDQYSGLDLRTQHKDASAPIGRFVKGVDFSDFKPIVATTSPDLMGAAIGNERVALGWFRDALCEPPDWPVRRLESQSVTLEIPGDAPRWAVVFCDTETGLEIDESLAYRRGDKIVVNLPAFSDAIAFRMSEDSGD
jgi:hypothetical protein